MQEKCKVCEICEILDGSAKAFSESTVVFLIARQYCLIFRQHMGEQCQAVSFNKR